MSTKQKKQNFQKKKKNAPRKSSKSFIRGPSMLGQVTPNEMVLRAMPLFPPRFKAMLRYADSFSLTTTSGAVNSYVFSTNGLFDPNITGTGHQPAGFDQMMLSYEHYTTIRSKIGVVFVNSSGNAYPTAAVSVRAATSAVSVIQQIVEDGMIVTDRMAGANTYGCVATLSTACDVAKFGGVIKILDNPSYQGNIAANPTEQSYYHIQTWNTDAVTATITCEVVIEYEAWFTEPRTLSQSLRDHMHRTLLSEAKQCR